MSLRILEELRRRKVSGGGAPKTYATWNPADKGTNIVLSNGDMTAEKYGVYTWTEAAVRNTIVKNSGVHTAEFYIVAAITGYSLMLGVATPTTSLTNIYTGEIIAWYSANNKYVWNVSSSYATSPAVGDYVGIKADFDAGTIQFYKNGVAQPVITDERIASNPYHLLFGSYYPGAKVTLNTGATPFQYPILPIDGWFE